MRHRRFKRPSIAQLEAIRKVAAECGRIGAESCNRPTGIAGRTWYKCIEMGYIRVVGHESLSPLVPLVSLGSSGRGWFRVTHQSPAPPAVAGGA